MSQPIGSPTPPRRVGEELELPPAKRRRVDSSDTPEVEDALPEEDPEEEEEEEAFKWPAYTIHRLNVQKVQATSPDNPEVHSEQAFVALIDRIKLINNQKLGNQATALQALNEQEGGADAQGGFKRIGFYRRLEYTSAIARSILPLNPDLDKDQKRTEYLFFYYRFVPAVAAGHNERLDLFVLATGHAWKMVSAYRDYDFPFELARRIAKADIYELKTRPLIGNKTLSSQRWENQQAITHQAVFARWVAQFRSEVRGDRLPEGMDAASPPRILFGQGAVRLQQGVALDQMGTWLAHYADVLAAPLEEQGTAEAASFDYLDFLQRVDSDLFSVLQKSLVAKILEAMQRPNCEASIRCYPSKGEDYSSAIQVFLSAKFIQGEQKASVAWATPPSVQVMLRKLRELPPVQELLQRTEDEGKQIRKLGKLLGQIGLNYSHGGVHPKRVKLLSCLEGEIVNRENGQHYFRVHGHWFQMTIDLLLHLHRDFQELLAASLIRSDDEGFLPILWSRADEGGERENVEAQYNLKYVDRAGFIVGDTACPNGIELFDLLYFTETDLYLYQVKEEFGHKTRDAASQILNAAYLISAAKRGVETTLFEQFVQELQSKCRPSFDKLCALAGGEERAAAWLEGLFKRYDSRHIHFVYAFANAKPTARKLEDELDRQRTFQEADFAEVADIFPAGEILSALQDAEILDRYGNATELLFKLSFAKFRECFHPPSEISVKSLKRIFKVLKIAKSQYNSTIARISLYEAGRKVTQKYQFSFRICQINHLPTAQVATEEDNGDIAMAAEQDATQPIYLPGNAFPFQGSSYRLTSPLNHPYELIALSHSETEPAGFSADLQFWVGQAAGHNMQVLENLIRQLVERKNDHPQPLWDLSREAFVAYLVKQKVPIKEWLKKKNRLEKQILEAKNEIAGSFQDYVRRSLSSMLKNRFLAGLGLPQNGDGRRQLQGIATGGRDQVLAFIVNHLQGLKSFIETVQKGKEDLKFLAKVEAFQAESATLASCETEYRNLNLVTHYFVYLNTKKAQFLAPELELLARMHQKHLRIYFQTDDGIALEDCHPEGTSLLHLYWTGQKGADKQFYLCRDLREEDAMDLDEPQPSITLPEDSIPAALL